MDMVNKKINGVEFITALVVIDGHITAYGVRVDCKPAFIDDVRYKVRLFEHDSYDIRFTGVFYLDKRNITSQRPWYPLF